MRSWHRRSSLAELRSWALACTLSTLAPDLALASDDPPTIVLLLRVADGDPAHRWRAAERRTHDELRTMGLEVAELAVPELDRREADVAHMMAEHGATAAIQLERSGDTGDATIWQVGPDGAVHTTQLTALSLTGGEAASLAALRTAEAVHTGLRAQVEQLPLPPLATSALLETSLLPPAPIFVPVAPIALPPPPPRALPRPEPLAPRSVITSHHAFAVTTTTGGGPQGPGLLLGLELAYRRALPGLLSLQPELFATSTPGWRAQGDGAITMGLAGARLLLIIQPRRDRVVTPRLGLGGGAAMVWAIGRAPAPRRGAQDLAGVAALSASAAITIRVRPHLRLIAGVGIDLLLPQVVIRIAGAETSRLGLPLLRGLLGLEWSWSRPRPPR